MVDNREKLVELISDARINGHRVDDLFYHDFAEDIADHLIANGVTVLQWRDAKTDPPAKDGEYLTFISCEAGEWIETDGFDTISKMRRSVNARHEDATEFVAHWMPIPVRQPKESECRR